jgi:hypothetical protein
MNSNRTRSSRLLPRLALATTTALVLAACTTETARQESSDPAAGDKHVIGHIHGLGVDPADDTLYVAGHYGVFRVDDNGVPSRIADRWQDTMAFTIAGPHTFLGSGHPDLREDLPPHLGLIESTDAAETWEPLSLQGEADFHALEVVGDRVYGYDSASGRLLTTTDRESWTTLATGQFIDLASLTSQSDEVLATTPSGRLVGVSMEGKQRTYPAGPPLAWIDSTLDGTLVGTTADSKVFTTTDPTAEWNPAGSVTGQTGAIDATDTIWHVATDQGIYASTDKGETWTAVVKAGH